SSTTRSSLLSLLWLPPPLRSTLFPYTTLFRSTWERITLPFVKNLERLGVAARVRTVDSAQYEYRMKQFDFDMTVAVFEVELLHRSEEHTSELQSRFDLVCRLLLEKKKKINKKE